MVHMGMGYKYEVDSGRIIDIDVPVSLFDLGVPLMQAAVDGEPMPPHFHNVARTCDRPCRPHKSDFHGCLIMISIQGIEKSQIPIIPPCPREDPAWQRNPRPGLQ